MKKEMVLPRSFQSSFFEKMGGEQQFLMLIDQLPDVEYFAKDKDGRFVAASKKTLHRIGMKREEELLGEFDSAIHPPNVARAIRLDDIEVMTTRQPLVDRVEALYAHSRTREWFLTTKLPIVGPDNEVIGVMGFVRPYRHLPSGGDRDTHLQKVVAYIRKNHRTRILVSSLADIARISQRQLNRKFQECYHMSVQEFIMRTRIQAAGEELIHTNKTIGDIALDHGFYDQSFFTRYFRRQTGQTPLVYRRNGRNSTAA
ncbi:helix-turn-helix domain-containing protein [Verrucomicrobium spinosum]|uniref:helix-turn-helix domain-containing protein n=2 Tax=Verrucomicrobium spinosum TaxID=2736 RepID=UPI0001746163|nr:helix-turn-helix domain-containing protein [Verrucomicrobium spinosum]